MNDERKTSAKTSIWRIAGTATGAAIMLFGIFWIALPLWILEGLGPGNKWEHAEPLLSPLLYIGLLPIGLGLLLIWRSR